MRIKRSAALLVLALVAVRAGVAGAAGRLGLPPLADAGRARSSSALVGAGAELVCAVGDVDQGIFGWRGATIHNMFAFADDFRGARFETLSVNFRSGKAILDVANAIIRVWERPGDEERLELRPADDAPAARVDAFVAPHQLDEADEIARRIAAGGEPWSQYAVLVRTRSLFDPIYRALVARGVAVEVDVLGGFWTRPEILDVIAWLRVLDDSGDNLALTRLLLGPAYHLSRRDLFFLAERAKDENRRVRHGDRDALPYALSDSIVGHQEIAKLADEARERIEAFRATWRELAGIATRVTLADLVGEIARVSGLATELASSPNPEAELALRHLAKLRDLAQNYQPVAGSLDLAGFVDYLDSLEEPDQDEDELRAAEPNAVRLLTLHRAKGLEWDVVFLPGLAEGQMPNRGKGANNPEERWERLPFELRGDRAFLPPPPTTKAALDQLRDEEERRLMYVGITRAKRKLVLSRAWYYRDNVTPKAASPYWDEIAVTGLVRMPELSCPPTNPYPVGIELPPQPERRYEPPPPDPPEIVRLESELERLRAVAVRPRRRRAPRRRQLGQRRGAVGKLRAQPLRKHDAADGRAAVHALHRRGLDARRPDRRNLRARRRRLGGHRLQNGRKRAGFAPARDLRPRGQGGLGQDSSSGVVLVARRFGNSCASG